MTSGTEVAIKAPKPIPLALCYALGVAAYLGVYWSKLPAVLLDAHVYSDAIGLFWSGKSPYEVIFGYRLQFLYPPVVLYAMAGLARVFPAKLGWAVYLGLQWVSALALPVVMARTIYRRDWLTAPLAVLIFLVEADFSGVGTLECGNIAPILYLAVFLGAAPGLSRNRWRWFYAALFLVALVKVTFLVLLLLPVLAGRRQLLRAGAAAGLVGAAYLAQQRFLPSLYLGYQKSVHLNVVEEGVVGRGFLGFATDAAAKLHLNAGLGPYLILGGIALLIVLSLALLRRRLPEAQRGSLWATLVLVAVALCSPRLLAYDIAPMMPAAVVLLVHGLRFRRPLALVLATSAISIALLAMERRHLASGYDTLLLLIAFVAMYWRLWREASGSLAPQVRPALSPDSSPTSSSDSSAIASGC